MSPFERSVCACDECRKCCREQPGPLIASDVPAIAALLGIDERALADRYLCASPGAVVQDTSTGELSRIGTITPRTKPDGSCVFLSADERCEVHAAAPFGCAYFDVHQSRAEVQRRGIWYLRLVSNDESYRRLRASLPEATSYRPRAFGIERRGR